MISFFIPIRKNSKRIKNKNITKIGKFKNGLTEIKVGHLKKFRSYIKKKKKPRLNLLFQQTVKKLKIMLKTLVG